MAERLASLSSGEPAGAVQTTADLSDKKPKKKPKKKHKKTKTKTKAAASYRAQAGEADVPQTDGGLGGSDAFDEIDLFCSQRLLREK